MNIGEYNITTERGKNRLYRWVEAVNSQKEKTVIIQILQPGISPEITAQIVAYFDTLQAIRRKNLWLPEQVFSNADYPLVLVYPYLSTTPLGEILQASTEEEAIEWWHQASETLHTLHNKNIVHGCIALDSFVVVERSVCLTGFGYAPFLQMGEPKAIQECREVVAPEVLADHYLTSAADIYGFAKTVANWQPQLLTTSWYSQAANPNPEFRYPRIRDCFQYLQETLLRCVPEEYNQAQRTKTSEDAVETESNHQHQDIIPKYILEAKVEPSEAGEVCGGGSYSSYPEPKSVLVKAQPLAGWNFDHWSGDIEGEESSVTLTMNCDKLIVAYFVPSISPTESDNSTPNTEEPRPIPVLVPESLPDESSTKTVTPPKKFPWLISGGIAAALASLSIIGSYAYPYWLAQKALEQTQSLQAAGKYEQCVQQAKTVSPKYSRLYARSQGFLGKCLLAQAQKLAAKNQWEAAIKLASQVSPNVSAYSGAQKLLNQGAERIWQMATNKYQQGNLNEAVAIAKTIPKTSLLASQAQKTIQKWQQEWKDNDTHLQAAKQALNSKQWYKAIEEAKKVSSHTFWQKQVQPIISKANTEIAELERQRTVRKRPTSTVPTVRKRPTSSGTKIRKRPTSTVPTVRKRPTSSGTKIRNRPPVPSSGGGMPIDNSPACSGGQC